MDIDRYVKFSSSKLTAFYFISISSAFAFGKAIRENKIVKNENQVFLEFKYLVKTNYTV